MSKTPVQNDVAQRLKWARSRIFQTATEAADALDMKPVTLRAHENGQNGVNVYDLERYARRYGVNLQWILTGTGPEQPDPARHIELGDMILVEFTIEAGAWLPEDHPSRRRPETKPDGILEMVPFTDPRFPADMVTAVRLGNCSPLAHYISGTLLFIVEVADIGYVNGDHVLVFRQRGDFINLSVRRVEKTDQEIVFHSLTDPDEPPLLWAETDKEDLPVVTAVVVGNLTRRPVREMDIETLKRFEEYERSKRTTPKEWRSLLREASAIVDGKKNPNASKLFDSVESAKKFLDATDRSEDA